MRRTRIIPIGVASCLALWFLYTIFSQNSPAAPLVPKPESKAAQARQDTASEVTNSNGITKTLYDYLHAGYQKWVYKKADYKGASKDSLLIASTIANGESFGYGRLFLDYYSTLSTLDFPKSSVTLAFHCGNQALLNMVSKFLDAATKESTFPYSQVTVLYAPMLETKFKKSEHEASLQRTRRRSIASGRNFVLMNALEGEQYTLFLDADIVSFQQPDLVSRFIKSEKDIIVPRITRGGNNDYDKNSWRGQRIVPSDAQLSLMNKDKWDEANFEPFDVEGKIFHLEDHYEETKDLPESDPKRDLGFTVPLDSVGGAVLFVKSLVFKQGAMFPTMNVVGTSWQRKEGYDGIETEGLCYVAQTLGYTCHGMPNLIAKHHKL